MTRAQTNAVFRAIADPTRREILTLLRGRRHTVGEIAANFRTSRPAISKHLRLLRSAGLITTRKNGTARICGLDARPLRRVDAWLRDYEAFWGESLRSLKAYVEVGESHRESNKGGNYECGRRKRYHRSGNRDPRGGEPDLRSADESWRASEMVGVGRTIPGDPHGIRATPRR
jgi:DNA-binding transcriptional ArsR family regulator